MKEITINGKSKDILEENINKLKDLFPEIVTEDKIDFEKLQLLLGKEIDNSNERYNFTWHGKSKAIAEAQKPSTGTLRPCKEESKNWDTTENLYIEGDNLEVLKLLQKSYYNKVKMIYIDPPYNTGKDFVYPDNYKDNLENYLEMTGQVEPLSSLSLSLSLSPNELNKEKSRKISTNSETNGRYHGNWLNMIYPRLKLARNLLTDDGVIFISIDDNEVVNLKKICDEVFGESNFLTLMPRITKRSGKSSEDIAKNNDYLLLYSKSSNFRLYPFEHDDKGFKFEDEHVKKRGKYKLNQTLDYDTLGYISSLDFPIIINNEKLFPGNVSEEEFEERKKNNPKDGFRWRWSKDLFDFGYKNGFVVVKKYKNYSRIYTKTYQNVKIRNDENGNYDIFAEKRTKPLSTLEFTQNQFSNDNSKKDINNILENNVFDYSKPINLLKCIIKFSSNDNDIILDFFSGSSATGEAMIKVNEDDNVNRKFVMIQLPEPTDKKSEAYKTGYKTIAEIGKERIRRAGEKIKSEYNNDNLDIGFKVFKLDSSNLNKWNPDYNNLEQTLIDNSENLVEGRTELDLIYEIMLKYGINLTLPLETFEIQNKKIYSIGFGSLLICLDDNITKEIAIEIVKLKEKLSPETTRIVFKDNGFASDSDKTNIKETLKTNNIDEFITI